MINRVILLVIDGLGIGALPDAFEYGDTDANTTAHVADAVGGLSLPNLEALGLGHVASIKGVRTMAQPIGCFGRLGFASSGKDSVVGYWETCGVLTTGGKGLCAFGVPAEVVTALEGALGRQPIGHSLSSMSAMLARYGEEHCTTGAPLVWTDGGSTCHVAMHETAMPLAQFTQQCRKARKALTGTAAPIRIVTHSLVGQPGAWKTASRSDLVVEPPSVTMADLLNRSSQIIMGVGKVYDLFAGRGFTRAFPVSSAHAALDETLGLMNTIPRGLLYVSLDLLPEDHAGAAAALEEFDRRLSDVFERLRVGDLVMITSDHGRDVSNAGILPTREYVPLLVTGSKLAQGVNLGSRRTAADVGQTVVDALRADRLPVGESFLDALRPG